MISGFLFHPSVTAGSWYLTPPTLFSVERCNLCPCVCEDACGKYTTCDCVPLMPLRHLQNHLFLLFEPAGLRCFNVTGHPDCEGPTWQVRWGSILPECIFSSEWDELLVNALIPHVPQGQDQDPGECLDLCGITILPVSN